MSSALVSDVAVTWLGAAGCALYFHYVWRYRESGAATAKTLFLIALLIALFTFRGFFWIWPSRPLGVLVFAAATLLPIALALFAERLLRRHHPFWLKISALGVSVVFFVFNLFGALAFNGALLIAFLVSFSAVLLANGWLLWRGDSQLSRNEALLARIVAAAGVLAMPLAITDFREQLVQVPARLGALGGLIFVYLLLNLVDSGGLARKLLVRLAGVFAVAVLLACLLAALSPQPSLGWRASAMSNLPVTCAWLLLTAIVVQIRELAAQGHGNAFLRWLAGLRVDSRTAFLASLRELRDTRDHVVLGEAELASYTLDELFALGAERDAPVSLGEARAWVKVDRSERTGAAEQLVDILERHEMTHALLISPAPPLIVLLNLPQGANAAVGQLRASIIQRFAKQL